MVEVNFSLQLEAIRKKIKKGLIKESFPLMEELIVQLPVDKEVIERLFTDLLFFQNDFNTISKLEMQGIASEEHWVQIKKLTRGIILFVNELDDQANPVLSESSGNDSSKKHRVELILDLDFEKATESEIKALLKKLASIIRTNPDELIFKNTRPGSVIVEMELSEETIKKIKSLAKIRVLKKLIYIQVIDYYENNSDETESFNIYLPYSILSGAYLNEANLRGADLRGADLSWANLSWAFLEGADLEGADLSWAFLRGAFLSWVNLRGADLSGANLEEANLEGANLEGANLRGAIFQTYQAKTLEAMNVDISEVVFIDDNGKKVESWVEVE